MSSESNPTSESEFKQGLASPTLAQLYLEQGHSDRARKICLELLERDPANGYALVLLERLDAEPIASITAEFSVSSTSGLDLGLGLGELVLQWSVPRVLLENYDDPRVDIVVAISIEREGIASALRYSSVRCRELEAGHRLEVPQGPASAAVALVVGSARTRPSVLMHSSHHRPLRFLAVAQPVSW